MIPKPPRPVIQRGHPLALGLVGAWPLWSGIGAEPNVASNGCPLVASAVIPRVVTPFGYGYDYTGTGSAQHQTKTPLDRPARYPYSVWMLIRQTAARGAGQNYYFGGLWESAPHYDFLIAGSSIDTGSKLSLLVGDASNATYQHHHTAPVDPGTAWASLVFVRTNQTSGNNHWAFYLNGVKVAFSGSGPPVGLGSVQHFIGPLNINSYGSAGGVGGAPMQCAGAAYWSRALGTHEIQSLALDPWAMYRPASRIVRGSQGAAYAPWLSVVTSRRATR